MPKKKSSSSAGISIGGDAYTDGGDIAAGSITKGDVYRISDSYNSKVNTLFRPLYRQINSAKKISPRNQRSVRKCVEEIQSELIVGHGKDNSFIEERLKNIARIAPDIFEVVASTLANPVIGLGVVAKKIANRASETDVKKNE